MAEENEGIQQMDPKALADRLTKDNKPYLLDVREEHEFKICHLAGSNLIPLMTLFNRVEEVPKDRDVVAICRTGKRSEKACVFLLEKGFEPARIYNLQGGVHAWSDDVDSSFPKY